MHGDESELCMYENAICYDGDRLVLSVPEPPGPSLGSNEYGHIMRELTANCFDFRFYDPEAAEVSWCGCENNTSGFYFIRDNRLRYLIAVHWVPVRLPAISPDEVGIALS